MFSYIVLFSGFCNWELGERPCFEQGVCYHVNSTCNGYYDCPNDWADEQGCKYGRKIALIHGLTRPTSIVC